MGNEGNENRKAGDPAEPQVMAPGRSSRGARLWREITRKCDRFEDRPTRIAIVMAIAAFLSAFAAFRASDQERKSVICDRQLGQAQTYELVQRQRYLDAAIEHQRWSDRHHLATSHSETLLQHATSIRATHPGLVGGEAALFDVEAQLELAVARGIEPVREFTNPKLPGAEEDDLESRLHARAEQDVKDLGIAKQCAVHEQFRTVAAAAPDATPDLPSDENYLEQLRADAASLHRKALDDAIAFLGFVSVMVLFTLSAAFERTTRSVLEVVAVLTIPVWVVFAVMRSDAWMTWLLLIANTVIGYFVLAWLITQLFHLRRKEALRTAHIKSSAADDKGKRTSETTRSSGLPGVFSKLADRPNTLRGPSAAGNNLRRVIRGMEANIGGLLLSLAIVAFLAAYDYATHVTRIGTILVVVLLPIVIIIAAWRTVNAMRDVHATQASSPNRIDVSKGAFTDVTVAAVVLGVFVMLAPWVTLMVASGSAAWLRAMSWGGVLLTIVVAVLLVRIERWVRKRAAALDAGDRQCSATAAPNTASGTAKHTPNESHPTGDPPPGSVDPSAATVPRYFTVDSRFGRFVVFLFAITVLFSAVMTSLCMREGGEANEFAAKATSEQLELMRGSSRRAVTAYGTIERLVTLREVRLRTVVAKQLRDDANAERARESVAIWNHEARRWQLAKETVENSLKRDDQGDAQSTATVNRVLSDANGLDDDSSFLAKLFVESTIRTAAERLALWDAYDDADTASQIRADLLLAGATLFALALYLFGQSLAMKQPKYAGYVLTATGIGLLVGGIGFAGYGLTRPIPDIGRLVTVPEVCRTGDDPSERTIASAAAICYARAELLMALSQNPDYYRRAQQAYAAAMRDDMRPGFTLAHYRSLVAQVRFETPQRTEPISSNGETLQTIIDGERKVIEKLRARERAVPTSLRETLGFHQYLDAIKRGNAALLDDAVMNLRTAAGDEPQARFRFALAQLAAYGAKESKEAFQSALATTPPDAETFIAAINDLELLRNVCGPRWYDKGPSHSRASSACRPSFRDTIDDRKAGIMQALWQTSPSGAVAATHADLRASATPGGVAWRLSNFHPAPDDLQLVMIVSRNVRPKKDEPGSDTWYVIASASGPVRPSEIVRGDSAERVGFRNVLPNGGTCLASSARYRIQLWNGNRILAETTTVVSPALPSFGSVPLHAQGVTMCVPDGKDGWPRFRLHHDHLEAGYSVRHGLAGVDLFAFFVPRDASPGTRKNFQHRALEDALQRRTGRALEHRHFHVTNDPCPSGSGIPGGTRVTWAFPGFKVLAQTWSSQDGLFHVALVWDTDSAKLDVTCGVLASVTDLEVNTADFARDLVR